MRNPLKFSDRFISSLVGVASGWAVNFLVYIAITNGGSHDRMVWLFWTGGFCLVGWFFIGLPLALSDLDVSSTLRRLTLATVASGLAGALMIILFFGFSLSTPMFWFGGLAFMTGAASMLVYAATTYILCRSRLGTLP